MKKIVVRALFYKPETWVQIKAHALNEEDCEDLKYFYYLDIILDLSLIESAMPMDELWLKGVPHTQVRMKSGDRFDIKLSTKDLARITEHINAHKLICQINN